jgi:hypothetical protein
VDESDNDLWKRIRYDNIEYPRIRAWRRNFATRDAADIFNDEVGRYLANEREKARIEKEKRDTWIFGEKIRRIKVRRKHRVEGWRHDVLAAAPLSLSLRDGLGKGMPMGQSGLAGSKWASAPEPLLRHDAAFEMKTSKESNPETKGLRSSIWAPGAGAISDDGASSSDTTFCHSWTNISGGHTCPDCMVVCNKCGDTRCIECCDAIADENWG